MKKLELQGYINMKPVFTMANLNLNKEQIEALWPLVYRTQILCAVYAAGKAADIYSVMTTDDLRELTLAIVREFSDDKGSMAFQLSSAMETGDHVAGAAISFRIRNGYFASAEFLLPILGEEKMCDLIEEAVQNRAC